MANRKPRPGDRALILPPLQGGEEYIGTICLVRDECWALNQHVEGMIKIAERLGYDASSIKPTIDLSKPYWHCILMDGRFAHVHEDNLEPIDPDSDEEGRDTCKYDPRNVTLKVDGEPIEPVEE